MFLKEVINGVSESEQGGNMYWNMRPMLSSLINKLFEEQIISIIHFPLNLPYRLYCFPKEVIVPIEKAVAFETQDR
jgi:hypothetical protein